ncbi:MAG: alpha/beta hydrolase [Pseudomonadota bacterium]
MAFEESYLTVNGTRVRMRRAGKGPAMLYLHGANGAAAILPFMDQLAENFDVLVPEHPGFGLSDEPEWLENIHDLAYFYLDLLDQLGLDSVHVVGSSIGGWLAMELAIRAPARFKSLVLVGAAGIRIPEAQPGDIFLWNPEAMVRNTFHDQAIVEKMLSAPAPTPDEQDILLKNRHTVAALAWQPRLHDPFLHKWLHRATMPVKLVWGADDKIMPLAVGQALQKLLPNAHLDVFNQCGHLPQIERAAEFSASVKQFAEGIK